MLWSLLIVGLVASSSALNLPGVPTAFTETDEVLSAISDDIANKFADEYIAYLETGVKSATLRHLTQQLASAHSKDVLVKDVVDLDARDKFFMCTTCRATMNVFFRKFLEPGAIFNGPTGAENSKKAMLEICDTLDIQTEEVCSGLFDINWPFIEHMMENSVADSRSICGSLPISFCTVKQDEYDWVLDIDATGPAVTGPKSELPSKSDNDLNILHVTDIHYDPDYVIGAMAECEEPLCCQRHKDVAEGTSQAAGYWSDYRVCDSPLHMIEDAFDHMQKTHAKIDYIYQTGDIVSHSFWQTTREGNMQMLTKINDLMEQKFPGVPVYPCVGNHDSHPTNVFGVGDDVPEELSVSWLYEHLYSAWSKWLPASTKETILKGGYYTVSPKAGFRVISLNNNDCYVLNWWLYKNGHMAKEQLEWLHDTLLAAEKAGEYVHILAHFPSGNADCWTVWSREYNRLIERFSHIISGIFSGHSHTDDMYVHYSSNGHAVGLTWNGGSLTSYQYKNPNYVKYQVDPSTMQVLEKESWIFNLTEANQHADHRSPLWEKEFQFTDEFADNLSPGGIDELLNTMADHPDMVRKYWRYKRTSADPHMAEGCDDQCLMKTICRMALTVYDRKERCEELKQRLQEALDNEPTVTTPTDTTTTEKPDGAASLIALKITSILGLFLFVKFLF